MIGFAKAVYAVGSIWAALVVVVLLLVRRRPLIALRVALAAGAAWGIALLVNEILGKHGSVGARVAPPDRRRTGIPVRPRRGDHRDRVRALAVRRPHVAAPVHSRS